MLCPQGHAVLDGDPFCGACGDAVVAAAPATTCIACGEPMPRKDAFCGSCGAGSGTRTRSAPAVVRAEPGTTTSKSTSEAANRFQGGTIRWGILTLYVGAVAAVAGIVVAFNGSGHKPYNPADWHGINVTAESLTKLDTHCGTTAAVHQASFKRYFHHYEGVDTMWQDATPGGGSRLLRSSVEYSSYGGDGISHFLWSVTCYATGDDAHDSARENEVREPR